MTGDNDLLDQLQAREGIVCFAGAGGKKTSMVHLAALHDGRVGLTNTIKVPFRLKRESDDLIPLDEGTDVETALATFAGKRIVGYAGPKTRSFRLEGIAPETIAAIHKTGEFDATYVKVDGARMRLAKGHKPGEPILVPGTTTVLLFASVHVVGRTLDEETVHHPEIFAGLSGATVGDVITQTHLADALGHQVATIGATTSARIVPVINMADDEAQEAVAHGVADSLWQSAPAVERLAITSMIRPDPLKALLVR
ncbi:MAG: selenium cofactor biosynthesis protein YqeC [Pseudomonadota bacterium]